MESGSASEEAKAAVLPTRPRPDGLGANGLGATPAPASAGFNGVDMGSGTGASNAAWAGPGAAALAAGSDELIPAASAPSSRGAADVDARLAALPGPARRVVLTGAHCLGLGVSVGAASLATFARSSTDPAAAGPDGVVGPLRGFAASAEAGAVRDNELPGAAAVEAAVAAVAVEAVAVEAAGVEAVAVEAAASDVVLALLEADVDAAVVASLVVATGAHVFEAITGVVVSASSDALANGARVAGAVNVSVEGPPSRAGLASTSDDLLPVTPSGLGVGVAGGFSPLGFGAGVNPAVAALESLTPTGLEGVASSGGLAASSGGATDASVLGASVPTVST